MLRALRLGNRAARVRPQTTYFDYDLERNLLELEADLVSGICAPGSYRSFLVSEPKARLVSAAPFRDRVVHHAVVGVLEPIFERRFIHDSHACRKGKGTHAAVDRAHRFVRRSQFPGTLFPGDDLLALLRPRGLPIGNPGFGRE